MSNFENAYDQIRSVIASTLTSYTELNNPYIVTDEADIMLASGYTVGIAEGENSNRNICNRITINRSFVVILTKRYYAPSRDILARVTAEKAIVNDQISILKTLTGYSSNEVVRINYANDSGINFFGDERYGILQLDTIINVEYFETY
jgi:hypothetical protein